MKTPKLALAALLTSATIMLGCSSVSDDGAGGTAGVGGTAGSGGTALTCAPSTVSCTNGQIDPAVGDDACMVAHPPVLPDACDGTESLERPLSCTQSGNTITYRLTSAQIADDCNVGYDLDDCDGNSCSPGELALGEGIDGVDNALAALAETVASLGGNLGQVNQVLHDELCEDTAIRFVADANPEENCVTVRTFIDDEDEGTALLNLSDAGCISGKLSNIPFGLGATAVSVDNAVLRMTLSESGLANGIVGGTVDQAAVTALVARWSGVVGSAFVVQLLDITTALDGNPLVACNALSLALRVGGVAEAPATEP
jgi:hypothetical protein